MYRKIAIAGATAAVILGSGTAALAVSDTTSAGTPTASSPSASSAPSTGGAKGHGKALRAALRRAVHGQVVTRDKDGKFVTHDMIRGAVVSLSTSAVTVKAADGTSQRYAVTASTKVRIRTAGKGAPGKIADVHVGDSVLVAGTGTGTPAARHIVDVHKR